jgi:cysteine desulfurase
MARHYLDHASTSPPRPEAVTAMVEWLGRAADPGRVHTEGRMVRVAIEEAREQVAALVGARPREVVFTSGATEAVNAAVWGAMAAAGAGGAAALAAVEHSCVREASARHRTVGLAVDLWGRIDIDSMPNSLSSQFDGIVHCQFGNHEVGTLQPVADVVRAAQAAGALVHVDAAQAVGHVAVDFRALDVDLLSLSGHKFGGPPGVGALVVRRGLRLDPLLVGGEQERARRAGMENVPAIVGLGAAAAAVAVTLETEAATAYGQTARLLEALTAVDGVTPFGDTSAGGRLPHLVCVGVDGVEAEAVLLGLDQAGVAAHSGSACSSETLEPSPVLEAMGVDAQRSLRLSVGWNTTDADVEAAIAAFPEVVARLRALGGNAQLDE